MKSNSKPANTEGPDILAPVRSQQEIESLIAKLVSQKQTFNCRLRDGTVAKVQAVGADKTHLLCKAALLDGRQELASFDFNVDGVPYCAQMKFRSINSGAVLISIPSEVFKVQRRESFRIEIPEDYGAYLQVYSPIQVRLRVVDLSGGGLQAIGPYSLVGGALRNGDKIQGELQPGPGREALPLDFAVRRIVLQEGQCRIGMALLSGEQQVEMKVLNCVMEIYREVYSRAKRDE